MARTRIFASPTAVPATDAADVFVCECYLRSKHFESRIEIPLTASVEEKRQFIDMWMQMMITGLGIKANG